MLIPTTIVTIGGYFIANGLMYDFGAAIAELPTCWLQPGVGALIYIVVGMSIRSDDGLMIFSSLPRFFIAILQSTNGTALTALIIAVGIANADNPK